MSPADVLDDPKLYEDLEDDEDREARRRLMATLLSAGADEDEVRAAAREGRLATLPLDFVLGGARKYTLTEVARQSRLDPKFLRQVLMSLGHPNPKPREKRYSDDDVEVARIVRRFIDAGLSREGLLDASRIIGQSTARMASAVRELAGDALIEPGDDEEALGRRYVAAARDLTPLMGPVLLHQFNLHLREQATSDVITRADLLAGTRTRTRTVAVAFVDLSDFTRLGQRFGPDRVGAIGNRMAVLATEAARSPVELVKTIGDAAMLVSPEVDPLLDAVLKLMAAVDAEGEDFPTARAGLAFGDAVSRVGDWFGPAVNRASRIVDIAKPGTVLVDGETADRTGERFSFKRTRRHSLKGIDKRQRLFRLEPG
jgi:adenylate cyclase